MLEADVFDGLRVYQYEKLLSDFLHHDDESGNLEATAGGAGAGTGKHQEQKKHLARLRPGREIEGRVTGGRDDRADREGAVMQCIQEVAAVHLHDVEREEKGTKGDDAEVDTRFLALKRIVELSLLHQVVDIEVHTEHDHRYGDQELAQHAVVGHTGVTDGESTRAGAAEGDTDRVIDAHAAQEEQDDPEEGQCCINLIQCLRGICNTRHDLADIRSRGLGLHDHHIVAAAERKDRQNQDENAHAADPVAEGTPEKESLAEVLDLRKNRGTGRRKAGYDLEDRIDVGRNRAGQIKRQCADQRHHDPAQRTDDEALTRIIVGTLRPLYGDQGTDDERQHGGNRQGLYSPEFLIDQCTDDRQDHDAGFQLQHPSEHVNNHTKVHCRTLLMREYP